MMASCPSKVPWNQFRSNLEAGSAIVFLHTLSTCNLHGQFLGSSFLIYRLFQKKETKIKMLIPRELLNIFKNGNHHILRHGVFFLDVTVTDE